MTAAEVVRPQPGSKTGFVVRVTYHRGMQPAALPAVTRQPHHVCRSYDRLAEFEVAACDFLADGLRAGRRVLYVTAGDPGNLIRGMSGVEAFTEGVRRGAVLIASLADTYPIGAVIDPEEQVRSY
ncbi:MEDS domain-containing protein, partial [Actinosynnema sp. NPDC023658]|uniref:MEDS domain-containing protein n=1 Tax=Actinosynnema sp. NPDC023658 TaxID=3155465 RepID=UPI003404F7CF